MANKHHRASHALQYHRKIGNVKLEPCRNCGSNDVHAHHTDYSKPLQVFWLCRKHHVLVHRIARAFPNLPNVCAIVEELHWEGMEFKKIMDLVFIARVTESPEVPESPLRSTGTRYR